MAVRGLLRPARAPAAAHDALAPDVLVPAPPTTDPMIPHSLAPASPAPDAPGPGVTGPGVTGPGVMVPGVMGPDAAVQAPPGRGAARPPAARSGPAAGVDGGRVPGHVAVIMDGNGRWAAARGLPRVAGHRAGAQAVRRTITAAVRHGVPWLTLYAFSSENWRRPQGEVADLTGLLRHYLRHEIAELHGEGVRLRIIGDRERFEPDLRAELARAEGLTAGNARLNLTVALSYGGRAELAQAARRLAEAVREGRLDPGAVDEATLSRFLFTDGMPDPDLVIRTSGEHRLSNFLLWQSAYAELAFPPVLWPDFDEAHFASALAEFGRRERRFGARPG